MGALTAEQRALPQRSWWRRNAGALLALGALVPATFGTIAWNEWRESLGAGHWRIVEVAPGDRRDVGGAVVGPASAEQRTGIVDAPAGARELLVTIDVEPGAEPLDCLAPRLVEPSTGRSWDADLLLEGTAESGCFAALEPLRVEAAFAVPADADGPFAVDLELLVDSPDLPRLLLAEP